jgi:hypothetical protein
MPAEKPRCPHDGAHCHHPCDVAVEGGIVCWRERTGAALSSPHSGFPLNWLAIEQAMRRSVRGRATEGDSRLCQAAHKADPVTYSALNRYVRSEEQEAFRRSGGVG